MHAIILSIGDELVLGQTIDTNSAYLSSQLVGMGIGTLYHQTVADDFDAIVKSIELAARSGPLVIITGGLGPTDDDLTRQALAKVMGVDLVVHQPSLDVLHGYFTKRNRVMPEQNKIQAMHPRGTNVIPNSCGTAPGLHAQLHGADIFVTPGVPSEMFAMWRLSIQPALQTAKGSRAVILTGKINTFGAGESTIAMQLGTLMDRKRNPKVGTTVAGGLVSVRIRAEFEDAAVAKKQFEETFQLAEAAVGPIAFGRDDVTLQQSLLALLKEKHATLATAESCTGGMLGSMITDVPGSSAAYLGGFVTYSNAMKISQLGVQESTLKQYGAVSPQTAIQMAENAAARCGATLAISLTGVAGPDGGTAEKPVGLVYTALTYRPNNTTGHFTTTAFRLDLGGGRDMIRDRAAKSALQLLRLHLLGVPLESLTFAQRA